MEYKNLTVLTLVIIILFICLNTSFSATINVDNSTGSGGIRTGLNSANNYDTILLAAGNYTGSNNTGLSINKNVTIKGNSPAANVIIDAEGLNNIFSIGANLNITFINITFINGYSTGHGAAIYNPYNNGFLNITNCSFVNNHGNHGGAIITLGNTFIQGSTFMNNFANNSGAAIHIFDASFIIDNCTFKNNHANNHGGAIDIQGSNCLISNSNFINNDASNGGGAIWCNRDNLAIKYSHFDNNSGYDNGGAISYSGNNLRVESCSFKNNSAYHPTYGYRAGGGICTTGKNGFIYNSTFEDNYAFWYGGAIYTIDSAEIRKCTFINNSAGRNGGAISNNEWKDPIKIYDCVFINNTVDASVTAGGYSGAVYVIAHNSIISNSTFINNSVYDHGVYSTMGGAVLIYGNNISMNNCIFINNHGVNGGALYIIGENFTIIDSKFIGNKASSNGGAIFSASGNMNIIISNNNFTDNSALVSGGAIFNRGAMHLSGNYMFGNTASLGQMIYNNGSIGIVNLTYLNNTTIKCYYGENVILFIFLTDDMGNTITGQNISFFVNGIFAGNATVVEGYANLSYIPLQFGFLPVTGDYDGHGPYNINILQGTLNVTIIATNSTINVPKIVKVGETVNISGVASDENGNPLPNIALNLIINGQTFTVTTDNNGNWFFIYETTKSGNINVKVSWAGDGNYSSFTNSTSFIVKKIATNSTVNHTSNFVVGETITISHTLRDENGNILVNAVINFYINGKHIGSAVTDSNGVATISYRFTSSGTHNITTIFSENDTHLSSSANSQISSFEIENNSNKNTTPPFPDEDSNSDNYEISTIVGMKKTGMPIIPTLLVLITSISLLTYRKRK
ncbi:MAG: Ig-like domain repeat protein [Methanobacteriaceae archaeon]|jgi:predicted outer membrane repeat protein|nr:Ig-like domain repeat protein [Candidatus Methanorudis spinitermitis]